MEKARQFLCIYDKSNDYNERLLSLYNGLYLLLKDEIWSKVQGIGIEKERLEDALAYVREDEEKSGKTVLSNAEFSNLRSLLSSLLEEK